MWFWENGANPETGRRNDDGKSRLLEQSGHLTIIVGRSDFVTSQS
jgi:hypothetical protein